MPSLQEKQKVEGILRLTQLKEKFNLNANLIKYLTEGKLYYSYVTGRGLIGSIDTISYDRKYEAIVKIFEETNNTYVYHVIESRMILDDEQYSFLSLLFVSANEEEWAYERLESNYIKAFVINLENPDASELGDIFLDTLGESGALIRIR